MQENRIERIEKKVDKVDEAVQVIAREVQSFSEKIEIFSSLAQAHEKTLRGSDGSDGIIASVNRSSEIIDDLNGALRGKGDKPGLIAAIDHVSEKMHNWDDDLKWIKRTFYGILISLCIGGILFLIQNGQNLVK